MMNVNKPTTLQDISTAQETSRKLKEAGFPQEGGIAYWVMYSTAMGGNATQFLVMSGEYKYNQDKYIFPIRAFTFNELWDILPKDIIGKHQYRLQIGKTWNDSFLLYYQNVYPFEDSIDNNLERFVHKQPQEAAAELALWAVKEGYLKPKEISGVGR
jgi:hypothetical protein